MSEEIIKDLKENVIQGRKTSEDDGIDDDMVGKPAVLELTQSAIEADIPVDKIIKDGLTAGMEVVGEKFATKEVLCARYAGLGRGRRRRYGYPEAAPRGVTCGNEGQIRHSDG